jgi:hypothetical protein
MGKRNTNYVNLCEKFPTIIYNENDNLNIQDMKVGIIKKCWMDIIKFKSITKISKITGISEREIFRIAKDENFPKRLSIKKLVNEEK